MTRARSLFEAMVRSAVCLDEVEQRSESAEFELHFRDVRPGSPAGAALRRWLAFALSSDADAHSSDLLEVVATGSQALARFEPGDGTLELALRSADRGSVQLPLPFLWCVRVVAQAALSLNQLMRQGWVSSPDLSPRHIITLDGEPRLNTVRLGLVKRAPGCPAPRPQCLATTLASCLGRHETSTRLTADRPLLPAALVQFVDGAPARVLAGSDWQAECALLLRLLERLQGGYNPVPLVSRRSSDEVVRRQLSLLPAVQRFGGASAIDAFFGERCQTSHTQVSEFRAALANWRRERTVAVSPKRADPAHTDPARHEDTRARVAQARFELRRGRERCALLLAIDSAIVAPDSAEAWLVLAEIRGDEPAGARALCLGQAICAARGHATVTEQAREQIGLQTDAELAGYFREHGDYALAAWLELAPHRSARN